MPSCVERLLCNRQIKEPAVADDTLPILLMIIAFFLTFLMPVRGVSILGRRRLSPAAAFRR